MKRKFTFLITAALMLLTMMATTGTMWGQTRTTITDHMTAANLVATSSSYKDFSNVSLESDAVYAGNSAREYYNSQYNIQLRSNNSNSGIVATTSGGNIASITITVSHGTNTVDIYGKNTAYSSASDLYNNNTQGTKIGSLSSTGTINVTDNYQYVGIRSKSGALYLSSVDFVWETGAGSTTPTTVTIDDTNLTNTDVYTSTEAGSLSAIVKNDNNNVVDGATVTWSSSNTGVATIDGNGVVTLVAAGNTTITASYAGNSDYGSSSATYDLTVTSSAPYVQPTEIEAFLNNDLFGTNYSGSVSGITDTNPVIGTQDNIIVTYAGSGNHYINNSQIRFYPNNKLTFEAPSGYEIKKIVFTSAGTWAATISANGGTYNSSTKTWTGSATSVLFTGSGSSRCDMSKADIIIGAVSSLPTPTITIDATGITNTNVFDSTDAGSLSATVTYNDETVQGATVTWSGNNNAVATIDENSGAVTLVAAGSVTFTATFAGNESYNSATAQHVMTVTNDDPNAPGTVNNPYTVADAMAAIDAQGTINEAYVTGIVSQVDSYNSSYHSITYWISDDGETTTQLEVYSGKGLNGADFSSVADVQVGATVVVKGKLKLYNQTYEFDYNNELVSYTAPVVTVEAPTFSPAAGTYASAQEVEISCETDGATIYYTLDGTEPTEASTPYNGALNIETTTTVKAIAYKNTANSYVATATYHICSAETPYTVAQALAFNEYPTSTIWVHGIVSTAPTTAPSSGQLKYYISDNGEATNELYIYNGKGLNNAAFTAQDDIQVGDIVTITGFVKDYQGTLEFDSGNYLTSFERPTVATPTFTPEEGEYTEAQSVTIACATEGAAIYYTLDGTEPTNASTLYEEEISVVSTTTIKAIGVKAGLANSEIATATYTITIAPTASIEIEPASLSVDADAHEETFTVAYVSVDADLAEIRTCDEGGNDVSYDWFSATFASTTDHNNITCTIAANDGDARTAYFLVHVSGNVFSDIIAVSQEAYVVPPTPVTEGWVLTDLADLAEGDVFVIVGDNGSTYAMSNDNGTSSAPAAVEVTVSNYALSEEPAENLKWNLTIADGTYTFYPNGDTEKWLYCTNTNNGVRVGTNDNKTFTISNGYLFNSGTSRYVGIYNSQDWRCYTSITGSSNIKDQTFAFYKYVENPTAPKITLSSYSIATPATETIEILIITPANIENFDVDNLSADYCNADGSEIEGSKPDFVAFDFSENEGYKLTCTISDNDGDARTAYFKVIYELGENDYVYSNVVTVNQEAYVAPVATITVNPAEINIDANENIEELGVTVANISSIDLASFNIDYCNSDGSEIEGDKPDIIDDYEFTANTPEEGYTLTITFKANEGDARTAYFKVKYELGENDYVYSNVVAVNQESTEVVGVTYELVTSNNDIVSGAHYYIAGVNNLNAWFAMGQQKTNNRQAESVTVSNNSINQTDNVHEVVISSYNDGFYSIFDEDSNANSYGYLYAAGGTNNNYLKTYSIDDYDERGQWTISIDAETHVATITANITGRNIMRFNNGSSCFSCYASGQFPIYLFKKVDNSPSISADNVDIAYNETSGSIYYTINNYVEGTMVASTEADWISVSTYEQVDEIGTVSFTTTTNASYVSRSATVTLTYSYGDPAATVTKDVTVTQAAAPIPTYIVSFIVGEGGTFEPNEDFDEEIIEVEAGAYTLPSATKEGYTFDGWKDGEQTYAAGVEYTVSYDVAFTATYTELQHITIHFVVNGEADNDMDVLQGTPVELPLTSTLTPDGFAITGWSSEPSSTVAVPNPYTPESEVTLYALLTYLYSEDSFELVTDASDLADGDIVVIAALNSDYAMSITQNNNNRGQAAIVKSGNQIALSENVCEFVLGEGSTENTWSFYDAVNEGYIYAASSSSNYLRTETELSANSSWTISIEENAATITAQGSNTHNFMQYNSSSSIFSCYASGTTTQQPICIYKKNEASSFNYVNSITEPDAILDTNIPESTCYVVEDGAVLTFTGTNEGTAANLVVQEGGQLIHTTDVEATVQKGVSGYTNKSGNGWYLISSPVDNLPTSAVATGTYDLFAYDEATAYWWVDHAIPGQPANHTFTTLSRGKGYLYANAADVNLNYAGTMKATDANITVDLSFACGEYPDLKGFNLVGNPFTRNLVYGDMTLGGEGATSYLILNNDEDYEECNLLDDDEIKPGQGFFIQATESNQQLEFNPSSKDMSVIGLVSIKAGDENYTDKAYIQFGGGNTLRKMTFGEKSQVYVMNDDLDYAAARVEELAGTMPVHFVPIEDGFYTITVETKNIENLNYMHLIDNIKNTEIDLLVEPSYTFKASESDNADRFYLVFDFNNYTGVNENYTNDNFAHQIGDEIFVSGEGTLQVFDVLGRFVTGYNVNGDKRISTAEFNTGVYIFRMVGTEVKTQKIIVR